MYESEDDWNSEEVSCNTEGKNLFRLRNERNEAKCLKVVRSQQSAINVVPEILLLACYYITDVFVVVHFTQKKYVQIVFTGILGNSQENIDGGVDFNSVNAKIVIIQKLVN